jgi:hypothetical protein
MCIGKISSLSNCILSFAANFCLHYFIYTENFLKNGKQANSILSILMIMFINFHMLFYGKRFATGWFWIVSGGFQNLVDRYFPDKQLQQPGNLDKTLADFFPEP